MADLDEKRRQVAQVYAEMTDEELKAIADEAWTLGDVGKEALIDELARRKLEFKLAEAPPEENQSPSQIILRKFRDLPEALLAQGLLESAGIASTLNDETTIRMDWLWSNALGGVKLCVKPEDAEAASELLDQQIPDKSSAATAEGSDESEGPPADKSKSKSQSES